MSETPAFDAILGKALSRGGEFADIYVEEQQFTIAVLENGAIERVLAGSERGAGIRVIAGFHTFHAVTNDLSTAGLLSLAETISRAVGSGGATRPLPVTPRERLHTVGTTPLPAFTRLLPEIDRRIRSLDRRVRQVLLSVRESETVVTWASSAGESRSWLKRGGVFSAQVTAADDGVIQTGYEAVGGSGSFHLLSDDRPLQAASIAAHRALRSLTAPRIRGGMMPVVLSSSAGGTMVHEAIGHGLEGDLVSQGMSVYRGRVGEEVASPLVTIVDDPTIPDARGSYPFDDEGVPSRRTLLVEKGVLKGFLMDRLTAMKEGGESTGNGRRESYQHRPIVRMSNTLILPGETPPEEIVRSADEGLFVVKMGGGQVNTVTGDFVFEVSEGYRIEKGEVTAPVRGATLTGNGPEILKRISLVGNDLGFGIGTCGKDGQGVPVADAQPTLLIDGMTVGGSAG